MEKIDLEKIISGVLARQVILETLLEGPKTGTELRWALADRFDRRIDGVSDALLYFNLQHLENYGLISRKKEWKSKYASIIASKIQFVRNFFHISAPITILSGIDDDPNLIRTLRMNFRVQKTVPIPQRYFFIASEKMRRRIAGLLEGVKIFFIPEEQFKDDLQGMTSNIEEIINEEIASNELIINVSSGSRICSLVLLKFAMQYTLRCFYLDKNEDIQWFLDE